ncbi:hypothetical protein E3T33_03635 [Cryobacterium sp. TMT1-2-1]|nr:hypothetical protein E3T33_03635 [Cryobacterium sp. TMT1-2-1]
MLVLDRYGWHRACTSSAELLCWLSHGLGSARRSRRTGRLGCTCEGNPARHAFGQRRRPSHHVVQRPVGEGAYSARGTEVTKDDLDYLRRSIGALHFAGEYLGGDFAGLMEGALRSGREAAAEILGDRRPGRR